MDPRIKDAEAEMKAYINQMREKEAMVNRGAVEPAGIGEDCGKIAPEANLNQTPYLMGTSGSRRYTRADMHEKAAASGQLSAQRNASAAAFLRSYPQFETFLDLIKDGAITLY